MASVRHFAFGASVKHSDYNRWPLKAFEMQTDWPRPPGSTTQVFHGSRQEGCTIPNFAVPFLQVSFPKRL